MCQESILKFAGKDVSIAFCETKLESILRKICLNFTAITQILSNHSVLRLRNCFEKKFFLKSFSALKFFNQ